HGVAPAHPVPEAEHVRGIDPELRHLPGAVETATKCLATALTSPPSPASSHWRALSALVIVSSVVKVFDETTKRVSVGSRSRVASARSVPSTFDTKRKAMARSL